jgi:hypothetical protein
MRKKLDKAIIDLDDQEIEELIRSGSDPYTKDQARAERDYRSQNKNTKALNRWTLFMALATLLNSIATCVLVVRALGAL